ncbi:ABC transporter permease (plasmid) [Streptomyces sp. BI20]|uniref:ABC transporter permease n=1 Tax=Streptomyces sp. BI20 TaxID=3403460 RepID=UPI003C711E13
MTDTLTPPDTTTSPTRRPTGRRLGVHWLIPRQHRAALLTLLAFVLTATAVLLWQRSVIVDVRTAYDSPSRTDALAGRHSTWLAFALLDWVAALTLLPVALAVFLGAPLLAADRERGLAALVTTQSVTRGAWLRAKLLWILGAATLAGAVLSLSTTALWDEVLPRYNFHWFSQGVFDNSGPVLPAMCLFLTALGVTVGAVLPRVLPAMATTLGLSAVVLTGWWFLRPHLGPSRTLVYPAGADKPAWVVDTAELTQHTRDAAGGTHPWEICAAGDKAVTLTCLRERGIVDKVITYFPQSQETTLQWTAAGILVAGAAVLIALVLRRTARRPL